MECVDAVTQVTRGLALSWREPLLSECVLPAAAQSSVHAGGAEISSHWSQQGNTQPGLWPLTAVSELSAPTHDFLEQNVTSAPAVLQNNEQLYLLVLTGWVSRDLGSLWKTQTALLGRPPVGAGLTMFCCGHRRGFVPILKPLLCVAASLLSGHRRSEISDLLGGSWLHPKANAEDSGLIPRVLETEPNPLITQATMFGLLFVC